MDFYIADWHFGHKNVIAFDNRPFLNVEEMDSELMRRWNNAVSGSDTVYVLGDMFWCNTTTAIPVLKQLNGNKVLIKGNHDRVHDMEFKKCFSLITDYLEHEDDGKHVVLCHYPIPCFKNHYYGWCHLYGHVHTSFEHNMMENVKRQMTDLYDKRCDMYNVGCMLPYMDYTPRTLNEIMTN